MEVTISTRGHNLGQGEDVPDRVEFFADFGSSGAVVRFHLLDLVDLDLPTFYDNDFHLIVADIRFLAALE